MATVATKNDNLTITIGKAYNWISDKFGKEAAENITALTTAQQEQKFAEKGLATKEDLTNVKSELQNVKSELQIEIAETKVELIKWVIGIGLTTFLALAAMIIGLYFK